MSGSVSCVLIVDDEPGLLVALDGILKPTYTVYAAGSGETALKIAKKNKPDIILLDVMMPDMDGFAVLAELKKTDATRNIPVIFLTGLSDVKDEEEGLLLGAVDYIRKPFHSSIVLARVQMHLDMSNKLREKDGESLVLKTRQEVRSILYRELMYVDVSGHWLSFHLSTGENVEIYSTLKEYGDTLLADPRFARCHKSFLVNMDFIAVVEIRDETREIVLKNNEHLPVSKGYADFKKQYSRWVKG